MIVDAGEERGGNCGGEDGNGDGGSTDEARAERHAESDAAIGSDDIRHLVCQCADQLCGLLASPALYEVLQPALLSYVEGCCAEKAAVATYDNDGGAAAAAATTASASAHSGSRYFVSLAARAALRGRQRGSKHGCVLVSCSDGGGDGGDGGGDGTARACETGTVIAVGYNHPYYDGAESELTRGSNAGGGAEASRGTKRPRAAGTRNGERYEQQSADTRHRRKQRQRQKPRGRRKRVCHAEIHALVHATAHIDAGAGAGAGAGSTSAQLHLWLVELGEGGGGYEDAQPCPQCNKALLRCGVRAVHHTTSSGGGLRTIHLRHEAGQAQARAAQPREAPTLDLALRNSSALAPAPPLTLD